MLSKLSGIPVISVLVSPLSALVPLLPSLSDPYLLFFFLVSILLSSPFTFVSHVNNLLTLPPSPHLTRKFNSKNIDPKISQVVIQFITETIFGNSHNVQKLDKKLTTDKRSKSLPHVFDTHLQSHHTKKTL